MSEQADRYARLRMEVSLVAHRFSDWGEGAEAEDHFGPGELVDFLTEVAKALGQIDDALVTTVAVLTRLEQLYAWVRGKNAGSEKGASGSEDRLTVLSEGERILALLADRLATGRGGMPTAQLAALAGVPLERCEAELRRLVDSGLIHLDGESWAFGHRGNG